MRKILMSASALALVMAMSAPALAGAQANNGINCIDEGAPGQGAKALFEAGEGTQTKPGIGNLAKSFPEGTDFQQPPLLMNFFCVIQNGKGQGPGHEPPPPAD